jgi:excisionase family DNA binding protein
MTAPRLYTTEEAAARLQVTHDWYMKQLRARKLPARKAGKFWRVAEEDIAAAIEMMAVPAVVPQKDPAGLTPRSRRRLRGVA